MPDECKTECILFNKSIKIYWVLNYVQFCGIKLFWVTNWIALKCYKEKKTS